MTHGQRRWMNRRTPWPERVWLWIDKRGPDECWPWTASKDSCGYGHIQYRDKKHKATRVLWEVVHGQPPGELCVLHTCDNPGCCNPAHHYLGTQKDNARDREERGRGNQVSGPLNGGMIKAKLTADMVLQIRREYATGAVTLESLAKQYGVTFSNVSCVVLRKSWAWVA